MYNIAFEGETLRLVWKRNESNGNRMQCNNRFLAIIKKQMKKVFFIFILSFISVVSYGQSGVPTTKVKVDLSIPNGSKETIKPSDKLIIYLHPFTKNSVSNRVVAKKIEDNTFEFELPNVDYFYIGLKIGKFHAILRCIYNKDGQEFKEYNNYIAVDMKEGKYPKHLFLPPCI